jgi:hypothetical protein
VVVRELQGDMTADPPDRGDQPHHHVLRRDRIIQQDLAPTIPTSASAMFI